MPSLTVLRLLATLACLPLLGAAARADTCDDLARQIAGAIGGRVGKRAGPSIDIRMAGPIKFDVTCRAEPIVQATSAEPAP
ncbi:MAG: hypothetical protein INR70_36515, partial [Parafilimonas terrae]|nr:hypothetical protein [Parafilimonas terrae]